MQNVALLLSSFFFMTLAKRAVFISRSWIKIATHFANCRTRSLKISLTILRVLALKPTLLPLLGLSISGCFTPGPFAPDAELLGTASVTAPGFISVAESKQLDAIAPRKATTEKPAGVAPQLPVLPTVPLLTPAADIPTLASANLQHTVPSGKFSANSDAESGAAASFAVLSYHRVGSDKSRYTVSPDAFADQMRYLLANGYHTLTTAELERFFDGQNLPPKSVLITIDDGHRSSFEQVHQILSLYGFNAVYYPYSDFINNGGLSTSMMKDMLATGLVEFGLHSKTHAALTLQKEAETDKEYEDRILFELVEPATRLRRITGVSATSIAYPYGKVNRRVEGWIRSQGVALGFTVNCALNNSKTNPLRLNRCTIWNGDDQDMFAAKLERPSEALARIERGESTVSKGTPPEFLGHLADREFFTGIPIEPFAAYFVDPEGERLRYAASSLPRGLNIDKTTGQISGTPESSVKLADIVIEAIDETGSVAKSNRFSMVVY